MRSLKRACSAVHFASIAIWLLQLGVTPALARAEQVQIEVQDRPAGQSVPCRIHLKDASGKAQRADKLPFWRDHFVCPGTVTLDLPPGKYRYEVERGPEYTAQAGSFSVSSGIVSKLTLNIERISDLAAQGWWSGEMHVHRPIEDIELLMRAEDLHVAPVITWWNNRNIWSDRALPEQQLVRFDSTRYYEPMAGEDEREGGALLFFHLPRPLAIAGASREYPSPMRFIAESRDQPASWIDIEKPFWWDVPQWLASGQADSIGLANNHMCRDQMSETEAWGKPRDTQRYLAPRGNGYWSQEIYYHILNCGLRIPPSAGSASGVLPNPVGYNRIYAFLPGELDYESWWQAVKAGRTFVTNGPLLIVRANGQLPGYVFKADTDDLQVTLDVSLVSRDPIERIEIIRNGVIERSMTASEWAKAAALGSITFRESGWFLVRAIADIPGTFRFASTAPFYVELGPAARRVSKSSSQFFLDWTCERIERVKLDDQVQRDEVLRYHREAKAFWEQRVAAANAE